MERRGDLEARAATIYCDGYSPVYAVFRPLSRCFAVTQNHPWPVPVLQVRLALHFRLIRTVIEVYAVTW